MDIDPKYRRISLLLQLQNLPKCSLDNKEELFYHEEPLQGNFEGIGVEFRVQDDTIMVVDPLEGGPAKSVGVMRGDRIVKVDGDTVAGINISNRGVMQYLKGPSGTNSGRFKFCSVYFSQNKPLHKVSTDLVIDVALTQQVILIH